MAEFAHPRVVGIDTSIHGLAALRAAVTEARRRAVPLHAVRCHHPVRTEDGSSIIEAAFREALGAVPEDVEIHPDVLCVPLIDALTISASDPRDLIVVGASTQVRFARYGPARSPKA